MEALRSELNVPLDILFVTLRGENVKLSHLKSFLYLKFYFEDHFIINKNFFAEWADLIKVDIKTVRQHFKVLLNKNWIGYDEKNQVIFVRSLRKINKDGQSRLSGVLDIKGLKVFSEWTLSVIVAARARVHKYKNSTRRGSKNGGPLQRLGALEKRGYYYASLSNEYSLISCLEVNLWLIN